MIENQIKMMDWFNL